MSEWVVVVNSVGKSVMSEVKHLSGLKSEWYYSWFSGEWGEAPNSVDESVNSDEKWVVLLMTQGEVSKCWSESVAVSSSRWQWTLSMSQW